MKKFFTFAAVLFALSMSAQTLTLTSGLTEVSSSTKSQFYPTEDLYFIYNWATGGFEARKVDTRAVVYAANISTVAISGLSTAAQKISWIEATHVKANSLQYNVLIPKDGLTVRYTTSGKRAELSGRYSEGKVPIWQGVVDSIKTGTTDTTSALRLTALKKMVRKTTNVLLSNSTLPATVAAGAAAGTGPTITIDGDNMSGEVTLNTGSSTTTTGTLFTITFPTAAPAGCRAFLQESADASALENNDVKAVATANTIVVSADGNALTASTANFKWYYFRICR